MYKNFEILNEIYIFIIYKYKFLFFFIDDKLINLSYCGQMPQNQFLRASLISWALVKRLYESFYLFFSLYSNSVC